MNRNITSHIILMQINAKDRHVMFHGQNVIPVKKRNGWECDNIPYTNTHIVVVVMLNSIMKEMNLEMT